MRLPLSIIAILVAACAAVLAWVEISDNRLQNVRVAVSSLSPMVTAALAVYAASESRRRLQLADDVLADLTALPVSTVRLFFELQRAFGKAGYTVPSGFVRENPLHEGLRTLRKFGLIVGVDGSKFVPGRRYFAAPATAVLLRFDLKTQSGQDWSEIKKDVESRIPDEIQADLQQRAQVKVPGVNEPRGGQL